MQELNKSAISTNEVEVWKDIKGYEGFYQISNFGRVKSLERSFYCGNRYKILKRYKERIIKTKVYKSGYEYTVLCDGKKPKKFKIHRLVAVHFIENPENKPQIDHINTIKNDNRIINLRWVTSLENQRNPLTLRTRSVNKMGEKNPMKAKRRLIYQIDILTGKILAEHLGIKETAEKMGFHSSGISRCCSGKLETAHGFIWKYAD